MRKKIEIPAPMPRRKELSDTPIKLCNEISRLFRAHLRENDRHDGVMSQHGAHLVLSTLAVGDGINQKELVSKTHLRPPTVSVILRRMEEEGLVERRSSEVDRRAVSVFLTDAGRALDKENIERIKSIDLYALEGITESEIEALMKILPKIRNNLIDGGKKKGEKEQ